MCPSVEQLERYSSAGCKAAEATEIEGHLRSCAGCRSWVDEARADDSVLGDVLRVLSQRPAATSERPPKTPLTIGRYQVIRQIGEGGMGIVYEAEQANPHRRVALKLMRPMVLGAAALRRFEYESEFLGRLHHSGIAQVYEAGTADTGYGTQPFFAMELVTGRPLTESAVAGGWTLRRRLAAFVKVCEAVDHAHQKGVIHRDLKPSNILVDELGEPKVLDFGVARATDPTAATLTGTGQIVGTLPYMSPEQVAGNPQALDTRSDVYSLGVILYELLAGELPYDVTDKPLAEMVRAVREQEPPRLGTVQPAFAGDVELIVAKALEKTPSQRYQSASALAADIERYLRDEPIAARPASTWYQVQKFARRNRALVRGLGVAATCLLLGVIGTTWQAVRARSAEKVARTQRDHALAAQSKSERIRAYLQDMLTSLGPAAGTGSEIPVRSVLDRARTKLETELSDAPLVAAAVRSTLGNSYVSLGLYADAEPLLQEALRARRGLLGDAHPDVAASLNDLAALRQAQGNYTEAERGYRLALLILGQRAESAEALALTLNKLGGLLVATRQYDEAERLIREALVRQRTQLARDHPHLAGTLNNLAWVYHNRGNLAEAEQLYRDALAMRRRLYGDEHPDVALSLDNLAGVLALQGREAEAEESYGAALAIRRHILGTEHADVATSLHYLGWLVRCAGRYDEAKELLHEALEIRRRVLPREHPDIGRTLCLLGWVLVDTGEPAAGEPLLRESLACDPAALRDGTWMSAPVAESVLGACLAAQGRSSEAEPYLTHCYPRIVEIHGPAHARTAEAVERLVSFYEQSGNAEQAARWRDKRSPAAALRPAR